jgi:DNA mismatch repair protein MutS2
MDKHTFRVLEYEEVREIIALKTTNIYGREHIEKRLPLKDIEDIVKLQEATAEALKILDSTDVFTVGELDDIRELLTLAQKDVPLRPGEILQVNEVIIRSKLLKSYLEKREALLPNLFYDSEVLGIFPSLENEIKKAISSDGIIKDSASKKLESIREALNVLNGRIQRQLDNFLRNPDYLKMLQEPIITRREHRYVLPVKQEYRSQFPGLVLDSSASGATLFMEPTVLLNLTNEYRFQKDEEQREEEQIRLKISRKIAESAWEIEANLGFLGYYDSLQAASRFMIDYKCTIPVIQEEALLDLKNARHPLLGSRAVPIDINIGKSFRGLIITGPNTGGKTVTLKTAGILALMALSGFPIPADENSEVGLYTGIYADIGDEQSISQNLSTFSSHIANITKILPRSGRRTLVLLDEIGAGTDPSEGVALASGMLKYLIGRKSCVIATTHYNELKVFAQRNKHFANAAVEFNEETLEPTYRIEIGIPGRSCALKIAGRLGVPEKILKDAERMMGPGHFKLESLLSEIDKEKSQILKERESAQENREQMEQMKNEYLIKLERIDEEKEQIIEEALLETESLVSEIERELQEARREWRKSLKEHKQGQKSREEIRTEQQAFRSKLEETIQKLESMKPKNKVTSKEEIAENSFRENDLVEITSLNRRGRIIRIQNENQALVEIGNFKIEIPFRDMKLTDTSFADAPQQVQEMRVSKALTISDQIDMRGARVEDAIEELAKYIDDAMLANLTTFRILHGKGTGVLRDAIREYLQKLSYIQSFRDGELHEGGWGITVVKLRENG